MLNNPREIIASVGEWATRQPWHPKHAPDLGVAEEIGEACHAILKNYQGIRGFEDADKFHHALKDALGDIMVYMSHWCHLHGVYYNLFIGGAEQVAMQHMTPRKLIQQMLVGAAHLLGVYEDTTILVESKVAMVTQIAKAAQCLAAMHGWSLIHDCLAPTWHKVRQRDWNKSKMDGGDAEVAAGQQAKAGEKAAKEDPGQMKPGDLCLPKDWLEARGYTAPQFMEWLKGSFPASAHEQK